MDQRLAARLLALLGTERRLVHYWPGREAALLVRLAYPDGARVAALRRSRLASLLERPRVKAAMAAAGDGRLSADLLDLWPRELPWFCYALGFTLWGASKKSRSRYMQVSRSGVSLALLLNFNGAHEAVYRRHYGRGDDRAFGWAGHPLDKSGRRATCAWVRIDIAAETGEALIEEVQNDWLRDAAADYRRACKKTTAPDVWDRRAIAYWEEVGALHDGVWKEAALSAALDFLVGVVGVRTIWMHTAATGARVKRITGTHPPRSIYEDLPRRFCFERTTDAPRFLLRDVARPMRKHLMSGEAAFWRHQF